MPQKTLNEKSTQMEQNYEELRAEILHLSEERRKKNRPKYSNDQKLLILKAYLSDQLTSGQIFEKFGIGRVQLWRWKNTFAKEITHPGASHPGASAAVSAADANPTSTLDLPPIPPMRKKKKEPVENPQDDELTRLRAENQRLQDQLQMAQWMVHARDVMIEEAEKAFNIKIQKKSGAKQ